MNNAEITKIINKQVAYILKLIDKGKISEANACTETLKEFWDLNILSSGYSSRGMTLYEELNS